MAVTSAESMLRALAGFLPFLLTQSHGGEYDHDQRKSEGTRKRHLAEPVSAGHLCRYHYGHRAVRGGQLLEERQPTRRQDDGAGRAGNEYPRAQRHANCCSRATQEGEEASSSA